MNASKFFNQYREQLILMLNAIEWQQIEQLASVILSCHKNQNTVYLCGNGGSAANALHLANDLLYGVCLNSKYKVKAEALPANIAMVTCLGNDIGYNDIFSYQLQHKAQPNDLLIILSGSGNSQNLVHALKTANQIQMQTSAILGYSGGECKRLAKTSIHFPINDMQIAEDLQLIVGHIIVRRINQIYTTDQTNSAMKNKKFLQSA